MVNLLVNNTLGKHRTHCLKLEAKKPLNLSLKYLQGATEIGVRFIIQINEIL